MLPGNILFFVDLVFERPEDFEKGMEVLKIMTEDLKILGIYKSNLS